MGLINIETILCAAIPLGTFLLVCGGLLESRLDKKNTMLVASGFLVATIALQIILLFASLSPILVLTMLPLSAYLPVIICVHILSRTDFFQTTVIWSIGLFLSYTLVFLNKLLIKSLVLQGKGKGFVIVACLLLMAGLFLLVIFRYVRKAYRIYVLHNEINWMPFAFPTMMILLLCSYIKNSTTNLTIWILLFLTALSIFLVVSRALVSAAAVLSIKEAKKAVSAQLNIQQQEYEDIRRKIELGRNYRHDMRHHLTVLKNLADGQNNEEITQYISELEGKIQEAEQETYCENPTVNAVLSSYIGRGKKAGYMVKSKIDIPTKLPYDVLDICSVLANALENAINGCEKNATNKEQHIKLTAVFDEDRKLVVSVSNPCKKLIKFDVDGFPLVPKREGHGIGLRSVKAIADKYNGLFQCQWEEGEFRLKVVLFDSAVISLPLKKKVGLRKVVSTTFMSILVLSFAVNSIPAVQALEGIPGLGSLLRVVDFRSYDFRWGDSQIRLDLPKIEQIQIPIIDETQSQSGEVSWESDKKPKSPKVSTKSPNMEKGVNDVNKKMEQYVKTLREKFLWYVARKYNGYVGMDSTYKTLRNDDNLLVIRFITTLNVGGSGEYSRYFILDKRKGEVMDLWDLFKDNSGYIDVISSEVLRQMTEQVNAGLADYFIPGGILSDDDCFKAIATDQNFYINSNNQLVIVFDEYEVAPGKDGMPEFTIPTKVLKDILRKPSLLK